MKYVNEYRNGKAAQILSETIAEAVNPDVSYRFMEFCGGHTHTLFRYGIPDLLPANIRMMHGPGCPVCVLPMSRIDAAIELAINHGVTLCTYGDMLRVPGADKMSLQKARGQGADIRMIYSPSDAIRIAQQSEALNVVFFAIGFETTTPPTAAVLKQANELGLRNFFVFCNHVLTPPAIRGILEPAKQKGQKILDGLIGPGHVSLITGSKLYEPLAETYQLPIVISGFEPLDILHAIYLLVRQVNAGAAVVETQYIRAVTAQGNTKAKALIDEYLELRDEFEWRGLGMIPHSALKIREKYRFLDAEVRFVLTKSTASDNKACECPAVLRGETKPTQCKLFGNPCTPENPLGSCMVSSEGACAAYYTYRRTSE